MVLAGRFDLLFARIASKVYMHDVLGVFWIAVHPDECLEYRIILGLGWRVLIFVAFILGTSQRCPFALRVHAEASSKVFDEVCFANG